MRQARIGFGFHALLFAAVVVTFVVHEAAHWATGLALGHDMAVSLNGSHSRDGGSALDALLISAAGPAVTVLQAVVAFVLVQVRNSLAAYAFLYAAAFMRFAAAVVSIVQPNDEARISLGLGWGAWTLPGLVVAGLVILTWLASRRLRVGWKTNLLAYAVCSLAISAVVGLDMLLVR